MSPRERDKEEAKAKEVRVIGAKDLAEDRRMEAQQDACNIRLSETAGLIFCEESMNFRAYQKPETSQGKVINLNKKSFGVKM